MDAPRETFRLPSKLHRLWMPMLILGLLAWPLAVVPVFAPLGAGWVIYALLTAAAVYYLVRRYGWLIPREVHAGPDGLEIVYLLRTERIGADQITDVQLVIWETIQPPDMWRGDGMHGEWDSPDLGPVRIHATEPGSMAMIYLRTGEPLLIGVEFADELVEVIEEDILHRRPL